MDFVLIIRTIRTIRFLSCIGLLVRGAPAEKRRNRPP